MFANVSRMPNGNAVSVVNSEKEHFKSNKQETDRQTSQTKVL